MEKAANGFNYESIDTVDGAGNSSQVLTYSAHDPSPYIGISYYRLRQTDFDGSFKYSSIEAVIITDIPLSIVVYPNPVTDGKLYIKSNSDTKGMINLNLYDMKGKDIFNSSVNCEGEKVIEVPFNQNIQPGTYFLKLSDNQVNTMIKIMVM